MLRKTNITTAIGLPVKLHGHIFQSGVKGFWLSPLIYKKKNNQNFGQVLLTKTSLSIQIYHVNYLYPSIFN